MQQHMRPSADGEFATGRASARPMLVALIAIIATSAAVSLAAGEDARSPGAAQPLPAPMVQERNGITFVTGGVTDQEAEAVRAMAHRFNVRLGFYNARRGQPLSGVAVTLSEDDGARLLQVTTTGPLLFMAVPRGAYRVHAELGGDAQTYRFMLNDEALDYSFRLRVNEMEEEWLLCRTECPAPAGR